MFWKSVVGKLAITILLLVSFVLFILSILLLQFFERFHVQEAEKAMIQAATKISMIVEEHDDKDMVMDLVETVKEPSSKVLLYKHNESLWESKTTNQSLAKVKEISPVVNEDMLHVATQNEVFNEKLTVPNNDSEIMVIGIPMRKQQGAIYVLQSLDVINQTRAETTRIIYVGAAIAIVLTTIFAFFLSTRITAPLIQMRKAAIQVAKGEFNTKLPVLSNDEIGELAVAFNKMGKQLNFHIDALRHEKEQLSRLVNSMADGVITLTRDAKVIVINPPAEQFIRIWYFEHNILDEMMQRLPDDVYAVFQKVIEEEKEVIQEVQLQGRNWVMIMTPLYDDTYIRGAVAVIRDMTEERQMDKLRKDFISNVSHELRTPIALMQGYSEAIVDDIAESKAEKNELAQIILEESLRMSRLVNELLDIGRMEAGHIELNKEEIDTQMFVEKVYKKFYGMAEENGVQLLLTMDIEQQLLFIDPDRMEQVFTNLIDNAIGHTPNGGQVEVVVQSKEDALHVEVRDNGSGIPEEDLSFVFERFYKADKARTRSDKKGTG